MKRSAIVAALVATALAQVAHASCWLSHIDHEVAFDNSGIWRTSTYRTLSDALAFANLAGALWEGTDSRIGRTMWQAAETQVLTEVVTEPAKVLSGRMRPAQANDPCQWGRRDSGHSFPSGEAGFAAALVSPWVLEYGRSNPLSYGLLLLPAYVGVGRIKNQAHWQSDVLAGWAIGGGLGWWESRRDNPLVFSLMPGGAFVGIRTRF